MTNLEKIHSLVGTIANLTNCATCKEQAVAKGLISYYAVEHKPQYGGYRLVSININDGSHNETILGLDDMPCQKYDVFVAMLRACISGITYMRELMISSRRVFMAKAMWAISAPTVIGDIESVVGEALKFKNGIEYIKELEGTKFVRVSKASIKSLLSNTVEQVALYNALIKVY